MFDRVTDLLRRRPHQFDLASALRNLPDDIRFDAIGPYIKFVLRETLHEKRTKTVRSTVPAAGQTQVLKKSFRLFCRFKRPSLRWTNSRSSMTCLGAPLTHSHCMKLATAASARRTWSQAMEWPTTPMVWLCM